MLARRQPWQLGWSSARKRSVWRVCARLQVGGRCAIRNTTAHVACCVQRVARNETLRDQESRAFPFRANQSGEALWGKLAIRAPVCIFGHVVEAPQQNSARTSSTPSRLPLVPKLSHPLCLILLIDRLVALSVLYKWLLESTPILPFRPPPCTPLTVFSNPSHTFLQASRTRIGATMKQCASFSGVHLSAQSLTYTWMTQEDAECPLCLEEMDISDLNFKPCPCGYQVCTHPPLYMIALGH